jgi:hypothetical protein
MKAYIVRGAAIATLLLGTALVTGCAQSARGTGALPDESGAGYQSSYDYDPSTLDPNQRRLAALGRFDPLAAGLAPNQTLGFGNDEKLQFTYQQQFDCVVQPNDDRNFSGKPADLDPAQFASPECQVDAPSTIDPTGHPVTKTDPIYVLVPFFETDKKTPAFTPALGKALKKLFGFVPDAFKPDPGVPVQCPAPKDSPGTCTMHPLETDLGPLLTALGKLPKDTNLYVPLVNHDHVLTNKTVNQAPEWWQVIVVLVEDPTDWPNAAGTTGITSVAKLQAAQKNKHASASVPSNFFLYFSSKTMNDSMGKMPGMHG